MHIRSLREAGLRNLIGNGLHRRLAQRWWGGGYRQLPTTIPSFAALSFCGTCRCLDSNLYRKGRRGGRKWCKSNLGLCLALFLFFGALLSSTTWSWTTDAVGCHLFYNRLNGIIRSGCDALVICSCWIFWSTIFHLGRSSSIVSIRWLGRDEALTLLRC